MEGNNENQSPNSTSNRNTIKNLRKEPFSLKWTWLYIKSLKPLLLTHHPDCQHFENHTFKLGKYRLCIGCFIGYPVAIISVIFLYILFGFIQIDSLVMFIIGASCMSVFLLSPLKLTKSRSVKVIQKVIFNVGGAFLFWWVFTLTPSILFNTLVFIILFGMLLTLVNIYHSYSLYRTCKRCSYALEWDKCPGFSRLYKYCEEKNLPNLFSNLKP